MQNYTVDRKWADQFLPQIETAIRRVAGKILSFQVSTDQEDCEEATDYVFIIDTGKIACRIRRPECTYRDITIRAYLSNSAKTELAKLRSGVGARWYFYAWTYQKNITRYVLVDIEKMRQKGFFEQNRGIIKNKDGQTGFVAYSIDELNDKGCVVFDSKKPKW